jgi:gamma-glutamyl hercynylcysteine S-oxide synthase
MSDNLRERLVQQFAAARQKTLQIFDLCAESVLHLSPGFGFRPVIWHLAHIGAFEEYWLLNRLAGENPINERYQIIFDPIKTPRENSAELPSKKEMLGYLKKVRAGVLRELETADFADKNNPLVFNGYIFDLVLQHELQHQETLAYLFHLIAPSLKKQSVVTAKLPQESKVQSPKSKVQIEVPAENHVIGADGREFVYDNEMPAHTIFIPAFRLDKCLTTNAEYAEFIAEGGYERPELWSAEGWKFRETEHWQSPLYWTNAGGEWHVRTMFDEQPLEDVANHPVYAVSYYEAEAYARFRGRRLPTEIELERVQSPESRVESPSELRLTTHDSRLWTQCNYGLSYWQTTPIDYFPADANGFHDLQGNLWEWTTSDFAAYPGFEPYPYEDYSQTWFDGDHKVLRGGSWATSAEMLRPTFRNFFRRHFRIAFAGIRLAEST